jgi:hypothetical protein
VNYVSGYDDFMDAFPQPGIQEYSFQTNLPAQGPGNAWMGLYWSEGPFGSFNSVKERHSNGMLRYHITQPQGAYIPFQITFGTWANGPLTMNLSQNSMVGFKIMNPENDTLKLYVRLQDINGVELTFDNAVLSDMQNTWKYYTGFVEGMTEPLKPYEVKEFFYDFSKAVPRDMNNGSIPNPSLQFDYSQVKAVLFTLVNFKNTGAPTWQPLPLSNYPISFVEYFIIGDIRTSFIDRSLANLKDEVVSVYDMVGNLIASGKFSEINLTEGKMYIVKYGNSVKKILKF